MIFDIRNMLILTIKNLIKRMIYNKKLSSFEELGYSNVVNISKYLFILDNITIHILYIHIYNIANTGCKL